MATQRATHSQAANPRQIYYGYIVVGIGFSIMVLILGTFYSFGVFLKPILTDFGWNRAMISGAFSLSWIIHGLLSIAMGGLNDRFGPRIVLSLCCLLSGLGYLLLSQIHAPWQLYLFYGIVIGAGSSIFVPIVSTVARWFLLRRTVMTGFAISGIGIGSLVGPPVANWLILSYDWRHSFIILGITIMLIGIPAAQLLKRDPAQLGRVPYGANAEDRPSSSADSSDLSPKGAIGTWQFWIFFTMLICFGFCLCTVQVHIAPYATDLGISAITAARILGLIGGASIVGRIVLGSVGDRIGNRRAFILGFIILLIASTWLALSHEAWKLYFFSVMFGLGYGNLASQMSPLTAVMFGLASHGLIFGVANLGFTVGSALGPFAAGFIFDHTKSYMLAFIVSAGICVIGLILSLLLKPVERKELGRQGPGFPNQSE